MNWLESLFLLPPEGGLMEVVGWTVGGLSILLALVLRKLTWTGVAALVALIATVSMFVLDNAIIGVRATTVIGIPIFWTYASLIAFPLVGAVRFVLALRSARPASEDIGLEDEV